MRDQRPPKRFSPVDLLFYAEDPGAVRYIGPLVFAGRERGFSCALLAGGAAPKLFSEAQVSFEEIPVLSSAEEALDRYRARVVVVGTSENPRSFGLGLVEAARRARIPSVGTVDAFMNAAYRFRGETKSALAFAPDYLLVPDRWTKEEFITLGFPEGHVFLCGHPHYDVVRHRAQVLGSIGRERVRETLFPEKAKRRVIALFAAETSTGLNPEQFLRSEEYTLRGRGGSPKRTDIVLEEFLDALPEGIERPYLVLRLHPKNEPEEFDAYLAEFDQVSLEEPALDMVFACDGVFGMTSMLLLEATLMGRPTFSIVPREAEKGWLPSVRAGLTLSASTREAIRKLLPGFLKDASRGKQAGSLEAFVSGATERAFSFFESLLRG